MDGMQQYLKLNRNLILLKKISDLIKINSTLLMVLISLKGMGYLQVFNNTVQGKQVDLQHKG